MTASSGRCAVGESDCLCTEAAEVEVDKEISRMTGRYSALVKPRGTAVKPLQRFFSITCLSEHTVNLHFVQRGPQKNQTTKTEVFIVPLCF